MTLVVTHSTVTSAPADTTALVDGPKWDANHTLTGAASPSQGGTGVVNNDASTITISGSFGITFTVSATTSLTLPASGTLLYNGGPLGTPSSGTVTNLTGTASININGTVGATTPTTGAFTSLAYSTTLTGTSTNASALAVGRQGATDPVLLIDASTSSVATGLKVKGAAAAAGVAVSAISSGTNENLTIDAKGSGTITLGGTSTGAITLSRATTLSGALTYGGVTLSNAVTGTGNMVLSANPTFTGTLNAGGGVFTNQLTVNYSGALFSLQDTGTSFAYFQIIGSGGGTPARTRVGTEGGSGGALFSGASANATVLGSLDNNPVQFFVNSNLVGQYTTAGNFKNEGAISTKSASTFTGTSGTVGATDSAAIFNASGTFTATLPAAATYPGRWLYVKTIAAQTVNSASSNVIPLAGGSAGTALLTATAGKWAVLQSNGTNWEIFAAN